MIKVEQVGGYIKLTGLKDLQAAVERYQLPNPAYIQAVQANRFYGNLDKNICFAFVHEGAAFVPVLCYKKYQPTKFEKIEYPEIPAPLRDYQLKACNTWGEKGYGILQACAGSGKTVVASELIRRKAVRSVVVVPTKDIMSQWYASAERFCNFKFDRVGGGYTEAHSGSTAIVGTYQSLVRKPHLLRGRGLILIDECHRTPCGSIAEILGHCGAQYRYGCTATPWRSDGLHGAFPWLLGGISAVIDREEIEHHIIDPVIEVRDSGFSFATKNDANLFQNLIAECKPRNILCNTLTVEKVGQGHKCLILAQRIDQLVTLSKLAHHSGLSYCLVTGTTPKAKREDYLAAVRGGDVDCLFASYPLAGEGLDLPILSCLIYAAPNGNQTRTEQSCGRIARPHPNKPSPVVCDLVDGGHMPGNLWRKREKTYNTLGYEIERS